MADDRLRQMLAEAKLRSQDADRRHTGATGAAPAPEGSPMPGLGLSALSGGRSTLESTLGLPGDYPQVAFPLINYLTGWRPPNTEEIGKFTDQYSPEWLQTLTRHQPQGPVEEGYKFLGEQGLDPTNMLPAGAIGKLRKFF